MHGHGLYLWEDGIMYDGEFINDQKHGKGIITFDIALLNEKDQVHTTFRVVGIVEREADNA